MVTLLATGFADVDVTIGHGRRYKTLHSVTQCNRMAVPDAFS